MRIENITGLESIKVIFNDIIETGQEVVGWGATDRAMQLLPKFTKKYIKKREERGIMARQFYIEGNKKLETTASRWKKVPREFFMPATTLVYGDRVALMMWFSKPISAILIKNREIAEAYRHHFEFIWKTRIFTLDEILPAPSLKNLINNLFHQSKYHLVDRQDFYVIKRVKEANDYLTRIILLPPGIKTAMDFTGIGEFKIMSPHPDFEEANIEIKGGLVPGQQGFSGINNALKFCYYTKREVRVGQSEFYEEKFKSSGEPKFKVVKSNGWGFYHNLVNRSNEWLCLVLKAKLHPLKKVILKDKLSRFSVKEKKSVKDLFDKIKLKGDYVFKEDLSLINQVIEFDPDKTAPVLIEALNLRNSGNHEACTVFALLLKIGRKFPERMRKHIKSAIINKSAPEYYLKQLKIKLSKIRNNYAI
jgi:hypothetical protein